MQNPGNASQPFPAVQITQGIPGIVANPDQLETDSVLTPVSDSARRSGNEEASRPLSTDFSVPPGSRRRGFGVAFQLFPAVQITNMITNWARVASLLAFGAAVCCHLTEKGRRDCVKQVGHEISTYLLTRQKEWMLANDSWVSSDCLSRASACSEQAFGSLLLCVFLLQNGFVEFFGEADPDSTLTTVTLVKYGIVATLTLWAVHVWALN